MLCRRRLRGSMMKVLRPRDRRLFAPARRFEPHLFAARSFVVDLILIAASACVAAGVIIPSVAFVCERRASKKPCSFCGKLLSPPLYSCNHYLANGCGVKQRTHSS